MISHLDGAEIIKLSVKGNYGTIKVRDCEEAETPVCFLAICECADDEVKGHLFYCDSDLNVIDGDLCDDLGEAEVMAIMWAGSPIKWEIDNSEKFRPFVRLRMTEEQ